MASLRTLLAIAAASILLPIGVIAQAPPATSGPGRGPGRLGKLKDSTTSSAASFGIASTSSTPAAPSFNGTKLPWDNTFTDDDLTPDKLMIINWSRDIPDDEIDALDAWIQTASQTRSLGKRDAATFQYVRSLNLNHSQYSIVDAEDMPDDLVYQIMDRQEVVSCERNVQIKAYATLAQTNAPDGLVRLSNAQAGGSQYIFDETAGAGMTIYIIDTGVNVDHTEFSGRATFAANFVTGSPDTDENGHGTHCAGTAAGRTFGVAKSAKVVAVKVLDAQGSGSVDAIVSGMEFVFNQVQAAKSAANTVVSMSLGGGSSQAINSLVEDLTGLGIVVVAAAGNSAEDASTSSPASSPAAITVGAIDPVDDSRASFSNFGKLVDIYAPGVNVLSSSIGSNIATAVLSGTSMACPHVAGLSAYIMALEGISGAKVADRLTALAQASGATVQNNAKGTTDLIANNGFLG